jgi:hypothetical protein
MYSTVYVDTNRLSARVQQITGVLDRYLPRIKVRIMFEYRPERVNTSSASKPTDWRITVLQHRLVVHVNGLQIADSGTVYDHVEPYFGKDFEYTLSLPRSAIQSIEESRRDDVRLSLNISGLCLETDGLDKRDVKTLSLNIQNDLSQTQWAKLLKETGYQDTWVLEIAKPATADPSKFKDVTRFLEEAEAELSAGSPDDVIGRCRKALDKLDEIMSVDDWANVNKEIDWGSIGESNYATKSKRIQEIRAKIRDWTNIGPHSDKYVVRFEDAKLCYLLTASLVSYLSKMASRSSLAQPTSS